MLPAVHESSVNFPASLGLDQGRPKAPLGDAKCITEIPGKQKS